MQQGAVFGTTACMDRLDPAANCIEDSFLIEKFALTEERLWSQFAIGQLFAVQGNGSVGKRHLPCRLRPAVIRTTERTSPMKRLFIATALMAAMLVPASQALASSHHRKGEYAQFAECPLSHPTLSFCTFAESGGGFFQVGKKTVPLKNPVVLQGGLEINE